MKPKPQQQKQPIADLFLIELDHIINLNHGLVKLTQSIDWANIENISSPEIALLAMKDGVNCKT